MAYVCIVLAEHTKKIPFIQGVRLVQGLKPIVAALSTYLCFVTHDQTLLSRPSRPSHSYALHAKKANLTRRTRINMIV